MKQPRLTKSTDLIFDKVINQFHWSHAPLSEHSNIFLKCLKINNVDGALEWHMLPFKVRFHYLKKNKFIEKYSGIIIWYRDYSRELFMGADFLPVLL